MTARTPNAEKLLQKLRRLPPEKVAEVEDFVDFLCQRQEELNLVRNFTAASEASFAQVWDNADDAEYDRL